MKPAVLGGQPVFTQSLPFIEAFRSWSLTKGKFFLERFETEVAPYLQVKRAVGVSSCMIGERT